MSQIRVGDRDGEVRWQRINGIKHLKVLTIKNVNGIEDLRSLTINNVLGIKNRKALTIYRVNLCGML